MVQVGTRPYTYRLVEGWAHLPRWWEMGEVADVAISPEGLVFVYCRGAHPVLVLERDGRFVSSWGEGQFRNPHGLTFAPDGTLYLVDRDSHVVLQYTPEGRLLKTLGTRDAPSPTLFGRPFNMPAKVAFAPSGHFFVADGYGNRRVHKFAPDGTLLLSWGEPGTGPGQFALVHSLIVDPRGRVLVCDRENDRIQIFDQEGRFLGQWTGIPRPAGLALDAQGTLYVAELGSRSGPPGVSIWTLDGQCLARWSKEQCPTIAAPHALAVDARGDIYLAEVAPGRQLLKFARL
ncbi:MAG: peptidyl-alpha-hydroxyglycine alpha-amidating lyase family protein [Dehalococcoidia bacterium]|nr:peptidyl-alpha-hydroxyglycine alpha-amidating lyase family protein [Dehalococcoidia bacterium]MDW8120413.1 peptidyl-alpha-hydroxyglycine alpha-amidating lyase family protein [Chloroflexota bacterium]